MQKTASDSNCYLEAYKEQKMSKIIVSVVLILTVAGLFQVLAEGRESYRRDVSASLDEQPSPSPLTRFEQSLLRWGQVQRAALEPATPSPLTRFERSLLRWGQLQAEEQILS
jgi:hypothetical protein